MIINHTYTPLFIGYNSSVNCYSPLKTTFFLGETTLNFAGPGAQRSTGRELGPRGARLAGQADETSGGKPWEELADFPHFLG